MAQTGYAYNPASLSDEELKNYINDFQNQLSRHSASDTNASAAAIRQGIQDNLGRAQDELNQRQVKAQSGSQAQQIRDLFSQSGSGNASTEEAANNQRNAIDQIFGNQQSVQTQNLNNLFNQQRGQAIEEAAALGNLRQPGFQASTLNNIDASRGQAMAQLLGSLGAAQGQARAGVESDVANRAIQGQQLGLQKASSLAGLLQGNNQFGQTFGLQQNQFTANQRQQALENLFNQQAMDQAGQLGQLQANAQKKTGWDQFGGIVGGIGGLAGGVGTLFGGLRGLGATK